MRKGETGEKRKTRAEERDVPVAGFKSLTVCRPISTVSLPLPVPKQPFTEIPSKAFDTFRVCLVRTTRFLKLCDDLLRSRTLVRSFDSYLDCIGICQRNYQTEYSLFFIKVRICMDIRGPLTTTRCMYLFLKEDTQNLKKRYTWRVRSPATGQMRLKL